MGAITAQAITSTRPPRGPSPRHCPIVAQDGAPCGNQPGWAVTKSLDGVYGITADPKSAAWCLGHALYVAAFLNDPLKKRAAA